MRINGGVRGGISSRQSSRQLAAKLVRGGGESWRSGGSMSIAASAYRSRRRQHRLNSLWRRHGGGSRLNSSHGVAATEMHP